jgi:hypothetical protein
MPGVLLFLVCVPDLRCFSITTPAKWNAKKVVFPDRPSLSRPQSVAYSEKHGRANNYWKDFSQAERDVRFITFTGSCEVGHHLQRRHPLPVFGAFLIPTAARLQRRQLGYLLSTPFRISWASNNLAVPGGSPGIHEAVKRKTSPLCAGFSLTFRG